MNKIAEQICTHAYVVLWWHPGEVMHRRGTSLERHTNPREVSTAADTFTSHGRTNRKDPSVLSPCLFLNQRIRHVACLIWLIN
jgi:hypothetical protein